MFLPQLVCVVGPCLALWQLLLGKGLDLVQGLEVSERGKGTAAGFLLSLVRVDKHASGMRKAPEVGDVFAHAPCTIAVGHQHALVVSEKCLRILPGESRLVIKMLSKPTRLEQQRGILKLFNCQICDGAAKTELEQKARRVAMLSTQPIFILREIFQYLTHQRLVAPGYTYMQDMVGRTVSGERKRITDLLVKALTPEVEQQLEALLAADDGMYRISALKYEPRDFSYGELRQEVGRRKFFQLLYEFGQTFLAQAGLSNESVKYYASLVQFYTVYKLQRMAVPATRLYLLCFAYHRFRQINDNLIDAFIYLIDQYEKQAKLAAETASMKAMTDASASLQAAGQVLNRFID